MEELSETQQVSVRAKTRLNPSVLMLVLDPDTAMAEKGKHVHHAKGFKRRLTK